MDFPIRASLFRGGRLFSSSARDVIRLLGGCWGKGPTEEDIRDAAVIRKLVGFDFAFDLEDHGEC